MGDDAFVADGTRQLQGIRHVAAGSIDIPDQALDHAAVGQGIGNRHPARDALKRRERLLKGHPDRPGLRLRDEDLAHVEHDWRQLGGVRRAEQIQALVNQGRRCAPVAAVPADDGEPVAPRGLCGQVFRSARQFETLAKAILRRRQVVCRPRSRGDELERAAGSSLIAQFVVRGERATCVSSAEVGFAGANRQGGEADERSGARGTWLRGTIERSAQPPASLREIPVPQPELPQAGREPDGSVRMRRQAPVERGAEVVVFAV